MLNSALIGSPHIRHVVAEAGGEAELELEPLKSFWPSFAVKIRTPRLTGSNMGILAFRKVRRIAGRNHQACGDRQPHAAGE
jgi:hypothetical protein